MGGIVPEKYLKTLNEHWRGKMEKADIVEERQIKHQITSLKAQIYSLSDGMGTLLKRLGPALRAEPTTGTTQEGTAQPEESLVDIAESVRQARYSVEGNLSILGDILHRLVI